MLKRLPTDALLLVATIAGILLLLFSVLALQQLSDAHAITVDSLGAVLQLHL